MNYEKIDFFFIIFIYFIHGASELGPYYILSTDTQKRSENEKRISQQTYTEDVKIEAPKSLGQLICVARTTKSKTQKTTCNRIGNFTQYYLSVGNW